MYKLAQHFPNDVCAVLSGVLVLLYAVFVMLIKSYSSRQIFLSFDQLIQPINFHGSMLFQLLYTNITSYYAHIIHMDWYKCSVT